MQLSVETIGKHYNRRWLFRNISFSLKTGDSIAVLGRNGSGKSSLLQIVYGLIQSSEGKVSLQGQEVLSPDKVFNMTSPALLLPVEFSLQELIQYQREMGKLDHTLKDFMDLAEFSEQDSRKALRYFSSGMLQRLKTALCIFGNNPVKLLDEPLSNMDKEGEKWYTNCIETIRHKNLIIVASNSEPEYSFTRLQIALNS